MEGFHEPLLPAVFVIRITQETFQYHGVEIWPLFRAYIRHQNSLDNQCVRRVLSDRYRITHETFQYHGVEIWLTFRAYTRHQNYFDKACLCTASSTPRLIETTPHFPNTEVPFHFFQNRGGKRAKKREPFLAFYSRTLLQSLRINLNLAL